MNSQAKKILICEDHQIVIDGLLSIFKSQQDYQVIGYITNGDNVMPAVAEQRPDVLLLDLNLPNKTGLHILKEVKQLFPTIKVIILTMYNKASIIKKVRQFHADGFLLKNCSSNELLNALDTVFKSKGFFVGKGLKIKTIETDGFLEKIKLTRREKEIVLELVAGNSVPKIAKTLFISTYTVETHKKNIYKKLNIHNSIDLVNLVNEKKLFS